MTDDNFKESVGDWIASVFLVILAAACWLITDVLTGGNVYADDQLVWWEILLGCFVGVTLWDFVKSTWKLWRARRAQK